MVHNGHVRAVKNDKNGECVEDLQKITSNLTTKEIFPGFSLETPQFIQS